jgi:hypothetical protein
LLAALILLHIASGADLMEVEFSCPLNGALTVDLIETMMSHLMHMRGQIPLPIQLLHQYSQSIQQTGKIKSQLKISRIERKIDEFLARYQEIIGEIHQLSQNHKIVEVGILFGPAPGNPREGYFLHFNSLQSEEVIPEKIRQASCRKCIRKFLEFWSQNIPKSPPIVNTFLSIRFSNENTITEASSPLNSEFSLRDDFSPQFRRKGLQPVHFFIRSCQAAELQEPSQVNLAIQENLSRDSTSPQPQSCLRDSTNHWFVLSRGIKGIKSLKVDS